jgi:hypothetical protein
LSEAFDFVLKAKKESQTFYTFRERESAESKYQLVAEVLEGCSHIGMVGKIGELVEGDDHKGLRIQGIIGPREEASGNGSHALSVRA